MLIAFDEEAYVRIGRRVANESHPTVRTVVETARRHHDRHTVYRSLLRLVDPEAIEDEMVTLLGEIDVLTSMLHLVREERARLMRDLSTVEAASQTDALTGIPNRRAFDQILAAAIADARARAEPLSLAMLDVDRFKSFNDRYGHETGDMVLRLVARTILCALRDGDTIAQFGGEEFVVILPRTDPTAAAKVAERLRRTLEAREVTNRRTGANYGTVTTEPPRVWRRLQPLPRWSHGDAEDLEELFARAAGARGENGIGSVGRARDAVRGDPLGRCEDRLLGLNAARVGPTGRTRPGIAHGTDDGRA